jgi:hypothetical protein
MPECHDCSSLESQPIYTVRFADEAERCDRCLRPYASAPVRADPLATVVYPGTSLLPATPVLVPQPFSYPE